MREYPDLSKLTGEVALFLSAEEGGALNIRTRLHP